MPRYHFNLADHDYDADLEGTELPGIGEARVQAIVFAGRYLSDSPGLIDAQHAFSVQVTDDRGVGLFSIRIEYREG